MPRNNRTASDGAGDGESGYLPEVAVHVPAHGNAANSESLSAVHSRPNSPRRNAVAAAELQGASSANARSPVKPSTGADSQQRTAEGDANSAQPEGKSKRHHHRHLSHISQAAPHALTHHAADGQQAHPTTALAWLASINTRWNWFNWACVPLLLPLLFVYTATLSRM